jgi:hypothetical protein
MYLWCGVRCIRILISSQQLCQKVAVFEEMVKQRLAIALQAQ